MPSTANLTLDEETHTYRLGELVLPSITQIIKALGIGYDHSGTDPIHSLRGRAVHKAVELVDNSDLDESSVDSTVRLYLDRYLRFKKDTGFTPLHGELRLASAKDGFAGTLDKVGWLPKLGIGILELKATEHVDMDALLAQLCGQERLYRVNYPYRTLRWKYGLQIRRDAPAALITKFTKTPVQYWLDLLTKFKEAA